MMTARWLAFAVWAGVAASALFWGLRWFVHPAPAPGFTRVVATAASPQGDLSRLFGGDAPAVAAAAPAAASRFHLLGVVAARSDAAAREGLALIAVDGKPARSYRIGAPVDGDLVLQDVRPRGVSLGPRDGAAKVKLEIPPPVAAATGTLPLQSAPTPPAPPVVRPSFGAVAPAPSPVEAEPQPAAPDAGHPLPTL
jgi:general secretion pathway protein C